MASSAKDKQDVPLPLEQACVVPSSRRSLDRCRDFGTVCGASNGAAYEQDGVLFGGDGLEILSDSGLPA